MPFLDFSQYKQFTFCEAAWFEKYVQQCERVRPLRQHDDPMTLGTLVHAALEQYRLTGNPSIPDSVVARVTPTADCLAWALKLAVGYAQTYPSEQFTRYFCEEPLRFPLLTGYEGLAKIDSYFHLTEPQEIETGIGGETFTLNPGWWIHEYKTKAADKDRGNYFDWWRICMQADFQLLALQAKVGERPQGIFVNVIEKPKPYVPSHTCKTCKSKNDRAQWTPVGPEWRCPACAATQKLDIVDRSRKERVVTYYRMPVTRTAEQLESAHAEMAVIAKRMQQIRTEPSTVLVRSTEGCLGGYSPCEYFKAHVEGRTALGADGFVQIDAFGYVGQ